MDIGGAMTGGEYALYQQGVWSTARRPRRGGELHGRTRRAGDRSEVEALMASGLPVGGQSGTDTEGEFPPGSRPSGQALESAAVGVKSRKLRPREEMSQIGETKAAVQDNISAGCWPCSWRCC